MSGGPLGALSTLGQTPSTTDGAGPPAYLTQPRACTEPLPALPTWDADDEGSADAIYLRLRGDVGLSDAPADWVVPFAGLLISPEARAREAQVRMAQDVRVATALRLREVACSQWLGRVEAIERDRRWLEDDAVRLRQEAALWRWGMVGASGMVGLIGLVAVVAGAGG